MNQDYVLVTAARNEENYIDFPIRSVIAQTILPKKWVIVSDGSTDGTDGILAKYAETHKFIEVVRATEGDAEPNFSSKVRAIRAGYGRLRGLTYSYIGNLDADVSFDKRYCENVLDRFHRDPRLGIAGGFILEERNGRFESRLFNTERSVAGAIQLFRRRCYEEIGGHSAMTYGGEDTILEVTARMMGWEVRAFADLAVLHHKPSLSARGAIGERFREGIRDYLVGNHPALEPLKCFRRMRENPLVLGGFLRLCGFIWFYLKGERRPVSEEFVRFLRREQLQSLKSVLCSYARWTRFTRDV